MANTGTTSSVEIDAKSLRDTVTALRQLQPDVLKAMGKQMRRIMAQLRGAAESKYRSHGGATPAKGGGYSAKVSLTPRTVKMLVMAKTKEAAIFEFAAVSHSPQGTSLIAMLKAQYGSPGRILWATYDAQKEEIHAALLAAVAEAESAANRRLLGR